MSIAWDDFRLVRAIAETGSLAGAAEKLSVNHSTVFRRLGALEEQLGARLFERARAGYVPTPTGEEMVRLAERMAEEVTAVERRIMGQDLKPSGELRVTTNDVLLVHLLTPILASFRQAFPQIRLDVVVGNPSLNLSKRDADVAIRASDRPGDTLVGRRIAAIAWAIYAREPLPSASDALSPQELRRHDWLGFSEGMGASKPAKWLRERVGEERVVYRVNSVLGLAEAAQAGIGLALLPCLIGDQMAGLTRLAAPEPEAESGLWLLTHPDLKATARVRSFMDHAARELARVRPLIEGKPLSEKPSSAKPSRATPGSQQAPGAKP